jgi:hypothetical protein
MVVTSGASSLHPLTPELSLILRKNLVAMDSSTSAAAGTTVAGKKPKVAAVAPPEGGLWCAVRLRHDATAAVLGKLLHRSCPSGVDAMRRGGGTVLSNRSDGGTPPL